ncbi:MAG: hypothetical protein AB7T38_07380 [Nitrospirales bacterium]
MVKSDTMVEGGNQDPSPPLAHSAEELRPLHQMCREGRLYEIERWITEGKPLQVGPTALSKGSRPKSALQIALETGQHSLVFLLLRNGYRLQIESYAPLDIALQTRRWDLVDLLLEWGAELQSADVYTVLNTYNGQLYERFYTAGYDLTAGHEMGAMLGLSTRNRPLLGFVKRHRLENLKIQQELNIALGFHVRAGNERGVNLCLWAGAAPHEPAPNLEFGSYEEEPDTEPEEECLIGRSATAEAANAGHLNILKRLGPHPARDDFDELYRSAKNGSLIAFLATIQPPKDLTSILSSHLWWIGNRFPWGVHHGMDTIEALLGCKVRWEETDSKRLTEIRRSLLKVEDYNLKKILSRLSRPEICAPETYQELVRTTKMQERLLALGLIKKPISEQEQQREEVARLMLRYNRGSLYEQVWSQPVQDAAKSYGISGVRLGKVCRILHVPVPPRGYWARVQHGQKIRRPPLPKLKGHQQASSN